MINGVHALIYSKKADEVRLFFQDVLKYPWVDAGHGWLVFALPPAELGIHPAEDKQYYELYLMCDDIHATMAELEARGANFTGPAEDMGWGLMTALELPGGGAMALYEPRHPTPP